MDDETIRPLRLGLWFGAHWRGRSWPSVHAKEHLRVRQAWANALCDAGWTNRCSLGIMAPTLLESDVDDLASERVRL